jgi:hypothetical protein
MGSVRTCRDTQSYDSGFVRGFNDVKMEVDKRRIEVAPDYSFQTQDGLFEVSARDARASHRFALFLRYAIENDPSRTVGKS